MYKITAQSTRAFSLVEVLIVAGIISLLASLISVNFSEARAHARDVKRTADMGAIVLALKQYHSDNGHYPCSAFAGSIWNVEYIPELVSGGYMSNLPVDPINQDVHYYLYGTLRETPADATCGDYATLHYDLESQGTECVSIIGQKLTSTHCHIFLPGPVPCSDPWLESNPMEIDCEALIP